MQVSHPDSCTPVLDNMEILPTFANGEVAEWSMAPHSKCGRRVKLSRGFESRPLRSNCRIWLCQSSAVFRFEGGMPSPPRCSAAVPQGTYRLRCRSAGCLRRSHRSLTAARRPPAPSLRSESARDRRLIRQLIAPGGCQAFSECAAWTSLDEQ